jgi:riboflavin kinase/FMN adenylyltransferase
VVITFDRHPSSIVAPERVPPLIYPLPRKLQAIGSLGPDATLLISFDLSFSRQSGEEFIRFLLREFGTIQSICVGGNFTFGHKRSGNVTLLRQLGSEFDFAVHGLAALSLDGRPVSSTRIREAIRAGDLAAASEMLARPYSLSGVVTRGDQLGRKLGFPTANLDITSLVTPPTGVYAVHAHVGAAVHRAVLNLGYRPTLDQNARVLRAEAHLLQFEGDLYDQMLELTFVEKLRDEKKFESLQALTAQISEDVAAAKAIFTRTHYSPSPPSVRGSG